MTPFWHALALVDDHDLEQVGIKGLLSRLSTMRASRCVRR
jgi:hypothetical protein